MDGIKRPVRYPGMPDRHGLKGPEIVLTDLMTALSPIDPTGPAAWAGRPA